MIFRPVKYLFNMQPRNFLNELEVMANDYDLSGKELAKILVEKSSGILALMAESKSIKEAELKWQCTPSGKKELELIYKMRGLKELISASKTVIRTKNDDYWHS